MVDRVRELLHTALHDEGGEMVEGAFVDDWVSNSYTAAEGLRENLTTGIDESIESVFRAELLSLTTDENVAARVLAILGEDKCRRFLLELLVDPNEKARAIGVRTSGYFFSQGFISAYFKDESPHVRIAAVETVAAHAPRFEDPRLLICEAFGDPDPNVRKAAYENSSFKDIPQLADHLWVETDLPALKAGVHRAAIELRREGVHYTGERLEKGLGQRMLTMLIEGLNDDETYLRKTIASAMNRLRGKEISEAMLARLKRETDASVRATLVLFDGFEEDKYETLLALFQNDADGTIRTRCAFLLERFPAAAPELAKAVANADQTVWRAATMSLGRVGTRAELPALLSAAANHDSKWFRRELERAIMDVVIKDAHAQHTPAPDLSAEIQQRINDLSPDPVTAWHLLACKESFNALPLFSNMLYTWAMRPDGSVLRFNRDVVANRTEEETDPVVLFSVVANGAKDYPELVAAIPQPPKSIRICADCLGKGWLESDNSMHCSRCNGIGWKI